MNLGPPHPSLHTPRGPPLPPVGWSAPAPSRSLSVEPEPSCHPAPDLAPMVGPPGTAGGLGGGDPAGAGLLQLGLSWLSRKSHPGDWWMRERRPGAPVPRALGGSVLVTSEVCNLERLRCLRSSRDAPWLLHIQSGPRWSLGWLWEGGRRGNLPPLPPEPRPGASGTPSLPGSPVVALTEKHTHANEGRAVKGNPTFSVAKMTTSFFPSCFSQFSASPSSRGTGEENQLSPKSSAAERRAQGCHLLAGAAADVPEDGSASQQAGGPRFGALCPMTTWGSCAYRGAVEIPWAVLLPCFFPVPS